jgi:hypothetical protein
MMKERKFVPIGFDNFEKIINGGYYYIDKTEFIKDLLDYGAEVNLFTRPRRFGKSLNMSMLQYFFENSKETDANLFDSLKIMEAGEKYTCHMNQYPVIMLTLKDANSSDFNSSVFYIKEIIIEEYQRHRYVLEGNTMEEEEIIMYRDILSRKADNIIFGKSLRFLSKCLNKYYNKKTILLIDEYDVPLETSYFGGFYDEMVNFIRSLFSSALKTNPALEFAVLTGCLRISKESIFTGLNNLNIVSIASNQFGQCFGFTEKEVSTALSYFDLEHKFMEAHDWYNGYLFGDVNVYNPWSVVKYIASLRNNRDGYPEPHWSNTSSNSIIRQLIEMADAETKDEIEHLIRGGNIIKPIHEDIVYSEITQSIDNLWNFLFFTGYLKKVNEDFDGEKRIFTMTIPNKEVNYIYKRKIREWFDEKMMLRDSDRILKAILSNDAETITDELNKRLMDMISFHDSAENFYHGFLLGILSNLRGYQVKSNRESGKGRSDICIKSTGIARIAVIFECKALKENEDPLLKCHEALAQIKERKYDHDLIEEGYKEIMMYAAVFRGKECLVFSFQN